MELYTSASRSLPYPSLALTPVNIEQLEPDHNGMVNYVEYINMVRFNVCYVRTSVSSLFRLHIKTHENNYQETAVSVKKFYHACHMSPEANDSLNILVLLANCTLAQMMND